MASSGTTDENQIEVVGSSYNADEDSNYDGTSDQDKDATVGTMQKKRGTTKAAQEKKIGHRRVGVGGEITYKKIQSRQIMGSIQLGIQQAVGGLASKPERDLLMQDFMTVETIVFNSGGSSNTPAHHYSEFTFKTYAPIAFRYFRDLFGIQPDDYLVSFCKEPLRELSNPGASGSIFYLTNDDEFIMKTVQHKEGEFLQKLLPGYYMNLNQNPRTLLPKFFGLYCYQCNSKNIRLVTMNNLLPSRIKIHQKYDLKGSTYKRKASKAEVKKNSPTFKDLDFMEHHPEGLLLEAETYTALVKTIQRDCRVLESFKIMDYSLLVGIHNLDLAYKEKELEKREENNVSETTATMNASNAKRRDVDATTTTTTNYNSGSESDDRGAGCSYQTQLGRTRSTNRQRLVAHSTAMESIQAESDPIDEVENLPPGGIPARNVKGERLLLFLGIIDILQSYRLKKKIEHTMKSLIHDGDTVSVHKPEFYANRFQDFMAKTVFKKIPSPLKHSPSKRKSFSRSLLRSFDPETDSIGYIMPGGIPSCSTPPPGFDEAIQDHVVEQRAVASESSGGSTSGKRYSSSSVPNTSPSSMSTPPPGKPKKSASHVVSVSDVKFEFDNENRSTLSVGSSSSASGVVGNAYLSSSRKKYLYTATASAAEGGTPTWTEGTPSFTESSSSGDFGWPSTPVRGAIKEAVRERDKAAAAAAVDSCNAKNVREESESHEVTEVTHL